MNLYSFSFKNEGVALLISERLVNNGTRIESFVFVRKLNISNGFNSLNNNDTRRNDQTVSTMNSNHNLDQF